LYSKIVANIKSPIVIEIQAINVSQRIYLKISRCWFFKNSYFFLSIIWNISYYLSVVSGLSFNVYESNVFTEVVKSSSIIDTWLANTLTFLTYLTSFFYV